MREAYRRCHYERVELQGPVRTCLDFIYVACGINTRLFQGRRWSLTLGSVPRKMKGLQGRTNEFSERPHGNAHALRRVRDVDVRYRTIRFRDCVFHCFLPSVDDLIDSKEANKRPMRIVPMDRNIP
jgi:hypothetical protein